MDTSCKLSPNMNISENSEQTELVKTSLLSTFNSETILMNCQVLLSVKNKDIICFKRCQLLFITSMLKIKLSTSESL